MGVWQAFQNRPTGIAGAHGQETWARDQKLWARAARRPPLPTLLGASGEVTTGGLLAKAFVQTLPPVLFIYSLMFLAAAAA